MTTLTHGEKEAIMKDMKSFDEPMPAVGIFWYDPEEHDFFGVYKKELTPKMVEDAKASGIKVINYEKPELTALLEKYFALPYFEFKYDEHWDLGHGWSGDL